MLQAYRWLAAVVIRRAELRLPCFDRLRTFVSHGIDALSAPLITCPF